VLKRKLETWYGKINRPEFIPADPVQFPRCYSNRADIEITAFLAATIAWGRRDLILRSAERMFALMGESPAAFVMDGVYRTLKAGCVHRTFFEDDLKYFCKGFKHCYKKYGSLEKLFVSANDIFDGIKLFRQTMAEGNAAASGKGVKDGEPPAYSKHVANPDKNSACKRINLALRWLVRGDGIVDLGLWKSVSPAKLYIPLDLHVSRTARKLGLLERKSNDRKAVEILTGKLREFCPEDPVKYDFALFGIGMEGSKEK